MLSDRGTDIKKLTVAFKILLKRLNNLHKACFSEIQDSLVDIVTKEWDGQPKYHAAFSGRYKRFSPFPESPDRIWGLHSFLFHGYQIAEHSHRLEPISRKSGAMLPLPSMLSRHNRTTLQFYVFL